MSKIHILRTTVAVTRYVWDEIMRQGVDRTCSYKKHSPCLAAENAHSCSGF